MILELTSPEWELNKNTILTFLREQLQDTRIHEGQFEHSQVCVSLIYGPPSPFPFQLEKVSNNNDFCVNPNFENLQIVGVGVWRKSATLPQFDLFKSEWYLSFLAVSPLFRKQGLGKQLLHFILTKEENKKSWSLHTHADNEPAQSLYKSFGFQIVQHIPQMYSFISGQTRDGVLLLLEIPS
jgi:ribosomal protein S18 acetylase RimI-like enzyme